MLRSRSIVSQQFDIEMAIAPGRLQVTRQVYLWLVACMYLFAFTSLYTQVPGLYGPGGLTPAHSVLPKPSDNQPWWSMLQSFPSLLVFHSHLQLTPSLAMELCCAVGALLALLMLMFRAMRCALTFFILWALYLSVYKVGQVFLWFQWDILLLEAGFLTILVAPFNLIFWKKPVVRAHDGMTLWLVRWLLFRLMFASGVVKLASNCPTWWGLTALNYHYESQCIPTPLSWYAHQLPEWFQKLCVIGTYFIEIATPVLFFLPVRSLRLLGFWSQVLLQVLIIVTGNYNFFNAITITLCFCLLDDQCFSSHTKSQDTVCSPSRRICRALFGGSGDMVHTAGRAMAFLSVVGYMLSLTVYYFDMQLDTESWKLSSQIRFSLETFESALTTAMPVLATVGALSLAVEILSAVVYSLCERGLIPKVWSLLQTSLFSGAVIALFATSLVSYGALDTTFYHSIPPQVKMLHDTLDKYDITNPYGLFRRMTGVGGRPELIIEGTNDLNVDDWKEYDFLYKPGNLSGAPLYVAPHQPRLDWQMWFAALGSYQHNPWLVHLVYRLLIGQKEVLQLIAPPPFEHPPRFIRARLYHYHYTHYKHDRSLFNQTEAWWHREFKGEYLFPLTWDDQRLVEYLNKVNYLSGPDATYPSTPLLTCLTQLRQYTDQISPPLLIWALFFTGVLLTMSMQLLFPDRGVRTTSPTDLRPKEVDPLPPGSEPEDGSRSLRKRHFVKKPKSAKKA